MNKYTLVITFYLKNNKIKYNRLVTNNKKTLLNYLNKILNNNQITYNNIYQYDMYTNNIYYISYMINKNIDIDIYIKNNKIFSTNIIKYLKNKGDAI